MLRFMLPRVVGLTLATSSLAFCDPHTAATTAQQIADAEKHRAFSPKEFRRFTISEITTVSPNTKLFRIALPSPQHEMVLYYFL